MNGRIDNQQTKHDQGFTLVELLIVIVILGILATVTVFAVTGITNKGKTSACKSDATTVQTAEESYAANGTTGLYTANQQTLVDAGLMHATSSKFNVNLYAKGSAIPANNGPDGVVGGGDDKAAVASAPIDTYTLTGKAGGDCAGMTF